MTWTRLVDNWMADEAFGRLSIYDRWHYLAMIQFCSRGKRYTGVIPLAEAESCSTAPEKPRIIDRLIDDTAGAGDLVYYIATIDGRGMKWGNCELHRIPRDRDEAWTSAAVPDLNAHLEAS